MSHWFHRNYLKATTLLGYDNVLNGSFNLTKLANELKKARDRLLDLLPDPSHSIETMNTAFVTYLSLMSGFFVDYRISGRKVRYAFLFKWTHSLLGFHPQAQNDVAFEVANMCVDVGIWHMKHASFLSSKKIVTMDDAKAIHTTLRRAAGIFQLVQRELAPLLEQGIPGSDVDQRVLGAYYHQCTAEAQEVTVARSINLQHNNNLISAIANETSKLFENAANCLKGLGKMVAEQWYLYLEIKKNIYLAYAYCYCGKHLLSEDHCGEAIRALRESQTYYNKALSLCKAYSKTKGPAKPVKPDGHLFFQEINSTVSIMLEKCERENGFIYHQKVPEYVPDLEMKATYGLVSPEPFNLPQPVPLWEAAFENQPQQSTPPHKEDRLKISSSKREKELSPVREVPYLEEPNKLVDHGCKVQ